MAHTVAAHRFLDLSMSVLRLQGALMRSGDELVADLGLSSARWRVLGPLVERPASVASIARSIGRSRQAVQAVADRLVGEGLACFIPNPDHKRSPLLGLTDDGTRTMAEVRRRQAAWANQVVDGLETADLAAASRTLALLQARLDVRPPGVPGWPGNEREPR